MSKVSVIIPTYNRAHLVAEAIHSALDQRLADLEVLVVDDGSTDDTGSVVESVRDPRVVYFRQENQGAPAARNAGLARAHGEYVMFLDSDDLLLPDALAKATDLLDRNPDVAFTYGQAYLMDEKRRIFGLRRQGHRPSYIQPGTEEIRKAVISGNHVPFSTMLVRRRHLDATGWFDDAFRAGSEDFNLWVRLAKSAAVAYIAEPLITYRMHRGNATRGRKLAEVEESQRRFLDWVFEDAELGRLLQPERPAAYRNMYLRLAETAYGLRDMAGSRRYLTRALRMRPGLSILYRYGRTIVPSAILNWGRQARHRKRVLTMANLEKSAGAARR